MARKKKLTQEEIHQKQIDEILKHKWILSEKEGRDLGEQAVLDWVKKHAADYREYWEEELKKCADEKNEKDEKDWAEK